MTPPADAEDRYADPYQVLGVTRDATQDEIKAAYRRLAREHHPDVSKAPDAETRFSKIQAAYDLLSTPEARAKYDRYGHPGRAHAGPRDRGATDSGFAGFDAGFDPGEFSDLFESFFGRTAGGPGFGRSGFSTGARQAHRSGPRNGPRPPARPAEIKLETEIEFIHAVRGTSIDIRIPGSSLGPGATGEGKTVSVKIPPATHDGARLRVPGARAGLSGNIILTIRVRPHHVYRMRDSSGPTRYDLEFDLPVTITEATLGTSVEIPTPGGTATVRIPPGSRSGARLRLRGCGMPRPKPGTSADPAKGDLIAVLRIVSPDPERLTPEQREVLTAIGDLCDDPRAELRSAGTLFGEQRFTDTP